MHTQLFPKWRKRNDDLICYKIKENQYLLVVNAGNIEKDWNWISKYNEEFGADLKDLSNDYSY
jgi:aminomethyltransferase